RPPPWRAAARRRGSHTPGGATWRAATRDRSCAAASLHHGFWFLRRRQAPEDLLHEVGLHVTEEELFLGFLGEDLRVAVRHIAGELHLSAGHIFRALAVVHAEVDRIAQAEFPHLSRAGERQDDLLPRFAKEVE